MPPPERSWFSPEDFRIPVPDDLGELLSEANSEALHSLMVIEDVYQGPLEFLTRRQDS